MLAAGDRAVGGVRRGRVRLLGMLGQAFTYHYFTDTVGALLLGTALVCLAAAWAATELDRCQPRCDLRHSRWLAWVHDRDARS